MIGAISLDQVVKFHSIAIEKHGGEYGLRDEGLLDSAISAPFQTFMGDDLFPTLFEKAARLAYGIIKNHPFVDGNKRTAVIVMLYFLTINDVSLAYEQSELIEIITDIASGEKEQAELIEWLLAHQA